MVKLNSITDFLDYFKDEQTCIDYISGLRWKNGIYCPHCGSKKYYSFSDNKTYKCADCRLKFNVKIGTIFESSKISLRKWLLAIYLLSTNKKGISSVQLAEQLGVTQKTAWFMDHRIRETYKQNKSKSLGIFELDETYVGGKEKNKHNNKKTPGTQGRSTKTKAPVMSSLKRGEIKEVTAIAVEKVNKATLKKELFSHIKTGSVVCTDEYQVYNGVSKKYTHGVVNHKQKQYVNGKSM